jgi:hypothetical protein
MIIKLRDIRSTFEGFSRLADLAAETKDCVFDTVEIDFSATGWFDAHMCAPLGVVLTRIANELNTVQPVAFPPTVEAVLTKNRFLAGYGFPDLKDSYGTTIPYRRFKLDDERYFVAYLNRHLEGKGIPRMSEGLGRHFKDSILELFMNSATHAESELGIFCCGQFYPTKQRLDFCVADAGIGFRRKIWKELKLKMNSDKAILWALKDGNTTKTGNVPGGLGLKLLLEFITLNGGRIQIISDRGYWEWQGGKETVRRLDLSFPGTTINIEINTADTASYGLSSEQPQHNLT